MIQAVGEYTFKLLSDPSLKEKDGEVFGVGLFAINGQRPDAIVAEIVVYKDDELFEEVLKRVKSKSKGKKVGKGSLVKVEGAIGEESWPKKGKSEGKKEYGDKRVWRPTKIVFV